MLDLSEEIARDLHKHLVTQVETNARIALALGLEQAEERLQYAGRCVSDAFDARYGADCDKARRAQRPQSGM